MRALAQPVGVLLACAIALPQALARTAESQASSPPIVSAQRAAGERLFERVSSETSLMLHLRAAAWRARWWPPPTVRRVIAAGDRIARAPYVYGGGHGSWDAGGYDCSGSVSYALHGGGLLDVALDSGQLMRWGEPGPGRWITIYASPGHAFMVVAGRRFDTSGRGQTGSRWQTAMRDASGYVVRHPAGL
ncbi:MAG: hypothetical protein QOJ35_2713 [Solirubrobacteraceae bacterium]|nr:hypothetical protein [Solirubrobacteraceae bacterium]